MGTLWRIARNAGETPYLLPRYRRLTKTVGILGTFLGLGVSYGLIIASAPLLGVDMGAKARGDDAWIFPVAVVAVMAIFMIAGCLLVATLVGANLMKRGRMTWREVKEYALFSRYPDCWFPGGVRPSRR